MPLSLIARLLAALFCALLAASTPSLLAQPAGRDALAASSHGTQLPANEAPIARRAPLPAPNLWSGVRLVSRTPALLQFSPLEGARRYRVFVTATETLDEVLGAQVRESADIAVPPLADGDYFVRVRGIDELGLDGRETVARLRVRARDDAPRPTAPRPAPSVDVPARIPAAGCLLHDATGICAVYKPAAPVR